MAFALGVIAMKRWVERVEFFPALLLPGGSIHPLSVWTLGSNLSRAA
jgi:hypothetical protein